MFSVIIPLYNKELSIKNTLQSVLNQTFQNYEIVIINDGSTDRSAKIVAEINNPKIQLIHQENQGVSAARNRGIDVASHEWIAFLDADDLWKEDHLSLIRKMILEFSNDKVFCPAFKLNDNCNNNQNSKDIRMYPIENYFNESKDRNFICSSSVCIHKSIFNDIGYFNIKLTRGEDLEMWTRIARKNRFIYCTKVTSIYRIDAENRSNKNFNLTTSRIYNYNFKDATSQNETNYYRHFIIKSLKTFIKKGEFKNFIRLFFKHRKYVTYKDILK